METFSFIAPVEALCCKLKYRANIIHNFIFVFFLYFFHHSFCRKDQFIVLIFKFGTQDFTDPANPHWFVVEVLLSRMFLIQKSALALFQKHNILMHLIEKARPSNKLRTFKSKINMCRRGLSKNTIFLWISLKGHCPGISASLK